MFLAPIPMKEPTTPPAEKRSTPALEELAERIRGLEAQAAAINAEFQRRQAPVQRALMEARAEHRKGLEKLFYGRTFLEKGDDPATFPQTFEELLKYSGGDYEYDPIFEPSVPDEERLHAYRERTGSLKSLRGDLHSHRYDMLQEDKYLTNDPIDIADLRRKIERINGSRYLRFLDFFTGNRETFEAEIRERNPRLSNAPRRKEEAAAALAQTQEKLESLQLKPNAPYDPSLHAVPAKKFLPRTGQSVLFVYENPGAVTLHLPSFPDERDLTQTVRFDFSESDTNDFADLVGTNLDVYNDGRNTQRYFDHTSDPIEALVPFPLEVVEVDGKERLRLPKVVWEKFGSSIV